MIDWDRIKELKSEVGEDDFAEVVEMFFEEVEAAFARILSPGPNALAEDIHFIKGSALNIGLAEVSRLCRVMESRLRDVPETDIDIRAIHTAFLRSKAEFASATLK